MRKAKLTAASAVDEVLGTQIRMLPRKPHSHLCCKLHVVELPSHLFSSCWNDVGTDLYGGHQEWPEDAVVEERGMSIGLRRTKVSAVHNVSSSGARVAVSRGHPLDGRAHGF